MEKYLTWCGKVEYRLVIKNQEWSIKPERGGEARCGICPCGCPSSKLSPPSSHKASVTEPSRSTSHSKSCDKLRCCSDFSSGDVNDQLCENPPCSTSSHIEEINMNCVLCTLMAGMRRHSQDLPHPPILCQTSPLSLLNKPRSSRPAQHSLLWRRNDLHHQGQIQRSSPLKVLWVRTSVWMGWR
jgi:hypothetical protein